MMGYDLYEHDAEEIGDVKEKNVTVRRQVM